MLALQKALKGTRSARDDGKTRVVYTRVSRNGENEEMTREREKGRGCVRRVAEQYLHGPPCPEW